MPKFHAYQSKSGGYVQTTVDENPQALQVAPSAATLFEDLGVTYGEYIPRDVTKPLIILGVLATKPHGRSKWDLLAGIPQLSLEYCELDEDQQETLREYLLQRVGDLTGVEYERLSQFIEEESPLEPLPYTVDNSSAATAQSNTELPPVPSDIAIDLTRIPTALRQRDTWLCWRRQTRDGKPTKVPISPHDGDFGKVNDPATWASFEVAVDALSQNDVNGLGYVFTEDDERVIETIS